MDSIDVATCTAGPTHDRDDTQEQEGEHEHAARAIEYLRLGLMGLVIVASLTLLANLFADLAYGVVDPRIRFSSRRRRR